MKIYTNTSHHQLLTVQLVTGVFIHIYVYVILYVTCKYINFEFSPEKLKINCQMRLGVKSVDSAKIYQKHRQNPRLTQLASLKGTDHQFFHTYLYPNFHFLHHILSFLPYVL